MVTLAPTSAYATARLTVRSADIVDGEVKTPDIALNAVTSGRIKNGQVTRSDLAPNSVDSSKVVNGTLAGWDVADDTVSGADVLESTLGQVPTALQGGLGRYGFSGSCDPETTTFVLCSVVQIKLDKPARLFVVGTVRGAAEPDSDRYVGECRIGTTSGPVLASQDSVAGEANNFDTWESMTLVAVTNVFPAGTHSVGIDCNQGANFGAIQYVQARVTAVALSAG